MVSTVTSAVQEKKDVALRWLDTTLLPSVESCYRTPLLTTLTRPAITQTPPHSYSMDERSDSVSVRSNHVDLESHWTEVAIRVRFSSETQRKSGGWMLDGKRGL